MQWKERKKGRKDWIDGCDVGNHHQRWRRSVLVTVLVHCMGSSTIALTGPAALILYNLLWLPKQIQFVVQEITTIDEFTKREKEKFEDV